MKSGPDSEDRLNVGAATGKLRNFDARLEITLNNESHLTETIFARLGKGKRLVFRQAVASASTLVDA